MVQCLKVCFFVGWRQNKIWTKTCWTVTFLASTLLQSFPRLRVCPWGCSLSSGWAAWPSHGRGTWPHGSGGRTFSPRLASPRHTGRSSTAGNRREKDALHIQQVGRSHKTNVSKGQTWRKIDCKMENVGVLTLRHTKNRRVGKSNAELAAFSHTETSNEKHEGHFCPCVKLINNSRHVFTNALRHIKSHHTHNAQGGHFSLSEFVIRTGLWTVRWGESISPCENKSVTVKQCCDFQSQKRCVTQTRCSR